MSDLVVISTHDGEGYLPECLESLGGRYPILVVDTGSSAPEFRELVDALPHDTARTVKTYQPGAWLYAFTHHHADRYLFIQDSVTALQGDYFEPFRAYEVTAWVGFDMDYRHRTIRQMDKIVTQYHGHTAAKGFMGPVFSATHTAMEKVLDPRYWPGLPRTKEDDEATERFIAMAFNLAGVEVGFLHDYYNNSAIAAGQYPPFRKIWAHRQ